MRHSANHLAIDDKLLRRAMTYLYERIRHPITIGILCHDLHISRRTMELKFKEHYNCTPWKMLCQMRVDKAKRLLSETSHQISTISELCGFNDPERMAVVFKRIAGHHPTHFRLLRFPSKQQHSG
ncbi:MAG: helix-turn-helix transcriptional regulator [Opitutales bacterium]